MKSDTETSEFEFVLDFLTAIWTPGAEALNWQRDFDVRSLEDILAAAERAGYEICYADLPVRVSGFALVTAGQPYIVVNRAKSPQHQRYTVAHELGHHVLHSNPSGKSQPLEFSTKDLKEAQAHLFAVTLVIWLTNDKEREDMLRQNPEAVLYQAFSIFMTVAVILIAALAHLWSRFSSARLPGSGEGK